MADIGMIQIEVAPACANCVYLYPDNDTEQDKCDRGAVYEWYDIPEYCNMYHQKCPAYQDARTADDAT